MARCCLEYGCANALDGVIAGVRRRAIVGSRPMADQSGVIVINVPVQWRASPLIQQKVRAAPGIEGPQVRRDHPDITLFGTEVNQVARFTCEWRSFAVPLDRRGLPPRTVGTRLVAPHRCCRNTWNRRLLQKRHRLSRLGHPASSPTEAGIPAGLRLAAGGSLAVGPVSVEPLRCRPMRRRAHRCTAARSKRRRFGNRILDSRLNRPRPERHYSVTMICPTAQGCSLHVYA
jgi:hypothetical protein